MPIPTYVEFIAPLFDLLGQHPDGIQSKGAYAAMADWAKLSAEEREQLLPSAKQRIYHNRVGWAYDRLKRTGLAESKGRGVWALSSKGAGLHATGSLSGPQVKKISRMIFDEQDLDAPDGDDHTKPDEDDEQTPDELIRSAVKAIHESVRGQLLETIGEASPLFFEELVLTLLNAMGYGIDSESIERVGGSADGGIDGIITLDTLGLDRVYVQAKRWKGSVGRPQVQGFFGALAGIRATRGVFITTSTFTDKARQYAKSVSDSLVLVDGQRLAQLMIDFEVGVSVAETIKVVHLDKDFFPE